MKISWITRYVALSGSIDNYNQLVDEGITAIINVREQHDDIVELSNRGIAYYWFPIPDHGAPRSDQINAFLYLIEHLAHDGEKILVHCAVGRGRSALLVILHVIKREGMTDKEAYDFVVKQRPEVALTSTQHKKLTSYLEEK